MVRTKSARHERDSSRVDTHLDDSSDNSEFSEEEFSDTDSDYGNGVLGHFQKLPLYSRPFSSSEEEGQEGQSASREEGEKRVC